MVAQFKEENNALREEIKTLRSNYEAAVLKLEKQAAVEKRYEESQVRFRTVFEQSRFGCKIITSDLLITQVNRALQEMLGYGEQELVGTRITDYSHPDFTNHWHDLQENLWTKQIPSFQLETCLVRKDGTTFWCGVTSILFRNEEAKLGYSTLEDISERKALEEKLQKHTSMLSTDLENFIYTASHELKAPITNMEGLTLALKDSFTGRFLLDERQNIFFSMLDSSVNKLKLVIKDLTAIARVQKEEVEVEMVSIDRMIDEVYQDLEPLKANSQVILHKHIEVNEIKIARKNIHSILHNLLSNTIKYCSPERTPEVTIETTIQAGYIVIRVEDNGLGMAENQVKKLFTMFKRFHTHVEGAGIGLYMTKRLVENMQGRIEVESKLDVGTIFRVYFPPSLN